VSQAADILIESLRGLPAPYRSTPAWEDLIHRAREADLLGTLAHRMRETTALEHVPAGPRTHLTTALVVCAAQEVAVHREVGRIVDALRDVHAPIILLKGAAYLFARLPPSFGRVFSDIDILVPKAMLPAVESALMLAGFATTHHHPYDQRYYRRWMHELPPMQHVKRMTVLDVHHTIVPPTARVRVDPAALFRAAVRIGDGNDLYVLAPADMVLHSATHLFQNEELSHGLRDLVDIHALLEHFGTRAKFWAELAARAEELDLMRPLYYALRWTSRWFGTRVPDEVTRVVESRAPGVAVTWAMDRLLAHAMRPTGSLPSTIWARRALYVRGQWLKMPMPLLAWHLTMKTFRREEQPA
jgi:hypothetical protein